MTGAPAPLRILHALHSFPPASHGGIETYVQMLVRAQRALGHEPRVLAGSESAAPVAADAGDPNGDTTGGVTRLPPRGLPFPLEPLSDAARAVLDAALEPQRVDLLHVHHWHNLGGDLVRRARRRGIPVLVTLHDLYTSCPLFFRAPEPGVLCPPDLPRSTCARCVGRWLALPAARLEAALAEREDGFRAELLAADAVLALSGAQRDLLVQVPWLAGIPLRVLPLPRPEVPAAAVAWRPADDGGLRIASWGGLVPGKGLHVLLDACERLPFAERVTLDHYGRALDADYGARLAQSARRVRFALRGPYGPRELAHCFPAYDVMVFPSLFLETHGFVVDEAMALGLPVVVGDRGAPQERVGARGRVFRTGDAATLARVLAELQAHPEQLAAMRAADPPPQPDLAAHVAELLGIFRAARRARAGPAG
jgi:glycosyltransferase involved in cell wall biosynthesis